MANFQLYGVLALLSVLYYIFNNLKKKFEYWKQKGVPQLQPQLFYGDSRELMLQKKGHGEFYREFYFKFKKMGVKYGGIYGMKGKSWIPIDRTLIKNMLTKDFSHFSAHNEKIPGLYFNNLFHMNGEEWKEMRRKLTPTFTSGKMKMMFDIVLEKTYALDDLVARLCKTGKRIEIEDVLCRFTIDVISSCGFGIECDAIKDTNSEFYNHVQNGFKESSKDKQEHYLMFKHIAEFLGLTKGRVPNFKAIEDFFRGVVRDTLKYREENKVSRNDFVHLMIQLKNKGAVTEVTNENEDIFQKTVQKEVMTLEDIAGQCLLFFSAGFGTSSTTMAFALLELAHNQDVQKKLREEIRDVLKRHNGKLSYEAVQEMTYCECVINETLRKYPALPILLRICTKNYTIPGTDVVIEKGTATPIPVWGLQMDPEYFPDPEKFIPERHNAENKSQIKEFTFLPFGEGPRMCLGLRFGLMQSKAGLATLINNYNFALNQKTPYPPEFKKTTFVPAVKGGIHLNVVKLS